MKSNNEMRIEIYEGVSKLNKNFKAIRLTVGNWNTLIFPRTKFEMDYIEGVINENTRK